MSDSTRTESARAYTSRMVERIVSLSEITPHPRNPRQHPQSQILQLKASHEQLGQFEPVILWQRPKGYVQVKGHGYDEGVKLTQDESVKAWVLPEDTPEEVVIQIMLASNLHAMNSFDDEGLLSTLLQEQQDAGYSLDALGTDEEAQRILGASTAVLIDSADPQEDYTPDLTPVMEHGGYLVKRDDLFQIAGVRGGKVRTVWALAQGATGLVTSGSRHSPHVHRVAAIAQRLGIPCHIHIATGENTPDVQGAEDAGAEIIRHKAGYLNVLNARAREDAETLGWTLIPFGVVCLEAVTQIKHQTANLPQDMKRLVVAVGSGVSLSGILHGLQEQGQQAAPILGICVGKDPVPVLDEYAPKGWRANVTLVQSPLKFEQHPKETRLGDIPLDPTYEAKCLPYLQEGDVLWSIGIRASEVDTSIDAPQALMPEWIVGDSRHLSDFCPDAQADLVFTCPPYYDLEMYSDDPDDLSTASTYSEFLEDYRAILKQCITQLKDNRFVCLVVGDIRDKKGLYRNFVSDTITACQDAGARLYNEAVLVTSVGSLPIRVGRQFSSGRKLGKTHQNVLVFIKGDPVQAVKDCGPVMVEVPEKEQEIASDELIEA